MPKIEIVRDSNVDRRGRNTVASMRAGETFRYLNGARDKVYMKVDDGSFNQGGWFCALTGEMGDHSIVDLETGNVFNVENADSVVVPVTCSLGVKE